MSDRRMLPDLDAMKRNPARVFHEPAEVLALDDLSYEHKLEILQKWELDARALQRATEENMEGGEDGKLREVLLAIQQLQADVTVDPEKPEGAPSKSGYRPTD